MKKISVIFVLAILFTCSQLFAAENKDENQAAYKQKKTVFNSLSDFFSTFDRPFKRPDNKQGFWEATADWVKTIDKQ
jgi:hypothetical protein